MKSNGKTNFYDRSKEAPAFETAILQCYNEIHDRAWDLLQRVRRGRKLVPGIQFRIEGVEHLFDLAKYKFDHLKRMIPTNPVRDTVYGQLKSLIANINDELNQLVPELIDETGVFLDYEKHSMEQDQWMEDIAFPQFSQIISNHEDCSVDMVFFDLDLEDFRYALGFVKNQEGLYLDEMGAVVDDYTVFNEKIEQFFEQLADFDEQLLY